MENVNPVVTIGEQKTDIQPEGQTTTIAVEVLYKGLSVGTEYEMRGVPVDNTTNQPVLVNGQQVVATTRFYPTVEDGYVELVFEFDAADVDIANAAVRTTFIRSDFPVADNGGRGGANAIIIPRVPAASVAGTQVTELGPW